MLRPIVCFQQCALPKVCALRDEFHSELVRVNTLKVNADGGDVRHTAAMLRPYADKPDSVGGLIIPAEQLKGITTQANAEGISKMCHCFGDRAVCTYDEWQGHAGFRAEFGQ